MSMESSGSHYTAGVGFVAEGSIRDTVSRFFKQDYPANQSESCDDLSNGNNHADCRGLFVVLWIRLLTCPAAVSFKELVIHIEFSFCSFPIFFMN